MEELRFGTLFTGALTTTILLGVITVYLLSRRSKPVDAWFLTSYLAIIFILTLSYTIRYAFFSARTLVTGQMSNLIVFGVSALIQFAYHYNGNRHRRESRIVLVLSLCSAFVIWLSLFFKKDMTAVYDFNDQYFSYEFGPRVGLFVLPGYIWAAAVFFRKQKYGRSNRNFAILTIITAVLPLFYLLFQIDLISRSLYNLIFNSGSLIVCIVIFIVYVNNSPLPTSYMIKMTGIPLVVVLSAFGITSNALMPVVLQTVEQRYQNDLEQTRFALESGYQSLIPAEVLYIIPADEKEGTFEYFSENLNDDDIPGLVSAGRTSGTFYLDLYDTASFYLSFTVYSRGIPFLAGFPYSAYRLAVHNFVIRIVIIVLITAAAVLAGFPLFFRFGLFRPLKSLLDGVNQVSSGNYRLRLRIQTEDELGQLARGFNTMVKSLKDAEGNFKALTENASDAILIISSDGRILFANKKAADISGYSFGKLMNIHFSSLIPAAQLSTVTRRFAGPDNETGDRPAPSSFETTIIHKSGRAVPVELTAAATIWHSAPAEALIIRDITERKNSEEALRNQQLQLMKMDKMASLGALVAGVAHEVNNPNQAISMNLSFLVEGLKSLFRLAESGEAADDSIYLAGQPYSSFKQSAHSSLSEIGNSTRRIDHIVKELKRLVRGDSKPQFTSVDLNEIVRTVADLSSHMLNKSTNSFQISLMPGLKPVFADRISLEQVVLNLLQNACQSLTSTEQSITVKTLEHEGSAVFEIEDEGCGIKEEDLPKLTDSFFTTKNDSGGTGLGLSVSARIIREHNGELRFSSKPGKGTKAVVILPFEAPQKMS